jgi:predicted molibdopterin-dependent oxidoreductase YjgC
MNGLLAHCRREGVLDQAFLAASVSVPEGFWENLNEGQDLWTVAATCDVPPADLQRFYDLFAAHPRTITLFSQGINQSLRGTDQVERDLQPSSGNASEGRRIGNLGPLRTSRRVARKPPSRKALLSEVDPVLSDPRALGLK